MLGKLLLFCVVHSTGEMRNAYPPPVLFFLRARHLLSWISVWAILTIRLGFSSVEYGKKNVQSPTVNEARIHMRVQLQPPSRSMGRWFESLLSSDHIRTVSVHQSKGLPQVNGHRPLLPVSNLRTPRSYRRLGLLRSESLLLSFVMIHSSCATSSTSLLAPGPAYTHGMFLSDVPSTYSGSRDLEVDLLMTSCQSIVVAPLGPLWASGKIAE